MDIKKLIGVQYFQYTVLYYVIVNKTFLYNLLYATNILFVQKLLPFES